MCPIENHFIQRESNSVLYDIKDAGNRKRILFQSQHRIGHTLKGDSLEDPK